MNLAIWLERIATRYTDKEAVFHGTKCIGTYMDLWRVACSLRRQLDKAGVKLGIVLYCIIIYLIPITF